MKNRVIILGSTGSIGVNTLAVISANQDNFSVFALVANSSIENLSNQCKVYEPRYAHVNNEKDAKKLSLILRNLDLNTEVLFGRESLNALVTLQEVDTVVCAISGSVGLESSLNAVKSGKRILLANKESLVMSGDLMIKAANKSKAFIIPVDSEHNALFQILMTSNNNPKLGAKSFYDKNIKEVQLTASGGPFLDFTQKDLAKVSIKQAINHPTWKMGKKISVDSATMMNKGFEIIEACILFGLKPDQVKVMIHRQSLMHAMVVFNDESVISHLSNHDMRIAISYALSWPSRNRLNLKSLDLTNYKSLTFEKVKKGQFKCLDLAYKAMYIGLNAPTILNAANEIGAKNPWDGGDQYQANNDNFKPAKGQTNLSCKSQFTGSDKTCMLTTNTGSDDTVSYDVQDKITME